MALSTDSRPFRLYVTHVDGEGHFLKISGQLDQQSSLMVESLFEAARDDLEKGIGAVPPPAIQEGVICAAKYKDGTYYRAKVISTTNLSTGLVGVHFIDYGNKDIISLSTIRFLDNYDPMFMKLRGQATDYYLSRVVNLSGRWEEHLLLKIQSLLCYSDYVVTIDVQTPSLPIISVQYKGNDLSNHLVSNRFGVAIPVAKQEILLKQMSGDSQQASNWQPIFNESPSYEHVPFLVNHNFPSNPASAMRLQQNVSLPFNGSMPPPSMISQRLLVNKASRSTINLRAPARQPQHLPTSVEQAAVSANSPLTPAPVVAAAAAAKKPVSPKKSSTYKSRLLEVGSQHKVFVSFTDEGPELFAVQLTADAKKLQDMMDEINRRPHSSLAEPPMIGTVCLGRMSGDRIICRAIVTNLSGSQCKLFFVDFGDTEMVSYYDIFDIPEEFVKPNVFAMRFCLSGVKKLERGPHLVETFRQLANGKVLTLKVVSPEGPPLIQYGELYLDDANIFDLLVTSMKDKLQFTAIDMLPMGSKHSVLVSYVDSCVKFFVQLSDKIDELNAVMDAVKVHCESSSSPGALPVGSACCARFPEDNNWYRARVRGNKGKNKLEVIYVDYGNEQEVDVADLRTITRDLIRLPAQALKCALKGFENRPVETKTSNQLEMLALEKTLMANIEGKLSAETMLVSLIDESVPLDVAWKMNQLSQPRGSHETKATTPIRKDAPESFSSPEGSTEGGRKKDFRREKSFKEERWPREEKEEFGQRGGSFRGRENKEGFDRAGPGRHSEKFNARSDRGDRNERRKPWENNTSTPLAPSSVASDEWEEPPPSQPPAPRPRENRDRDANRHGYFNQEDREEKTNEGWGNRGPRPDRRDHRENRDIRDNRDHRENRENRDHRENRDNRENREHRDNRDNRDNRDRDNRGERRDNWAEKKEWGQKRDFKTDRAPRSNFTPRDRAERPFDNKSEKSFGSAEGRERAARAPHARARAPHPQPRLRELADPVPLGTPFADQAVQHGAQHEVSVTWIVSPESFYTQILSLQPQFLEMMNSIPELYKGVKSYSGAVPAGASVLARYPADGVLYRATVVASQPFAKFIVRYVDFGNKQLVDAKDIWQLDRKLMELPKMAVPCALLGVAPADGEWKADQEIDKCFNAPRYQCVFQECAEERHLVSLWSNGASVADMLVDKRLAVPAAGPAAVSLKDEAIDLTIIVGQQVVCRVTHVEALGKFYVQLDLDKAATVETAIDTFDVSKLTPLSADSLTDGVHCTLRLDGKIYRAILNDVSDPANVKAALPDYGRTVTTAVDNLMILPSELSVYFYQALECCLNNYTSESEVLIPLEELRTKLLGNKFIIYINDLDGISLVSTLYELSTGDKIAIFSPDEGAYEAVSPLCARAVFNYNFGVSYVSHAHRLAELYLQRAADGERLAQLLDDLYRFYEEGTPEDLASYEAEGLCAAKSVDSNWYRATIVSVTDSEVQVQFNDYGNSETLPKESLKKLDPKFFEPCALALAVGLGLSPLRDDALATLTEWTAEKEVQVTVGFGPDGWLAGLHLDGVDLAMKLVDEKLAAPHAAPTEESPPETEAPTSLVPEGCTQVYISHIDTPGHFWLQTADKVDRIEEIQAKLQEEAGGYPDLESRDTGALCVAKYSADDLWYRAEVLDSDSDITTVRFVDYGNTDVLDNKPGLLKALPEELRPVERYAIRASVNAIPTGTGQWSEAAADHFVQLVGDLSAPVDASIVLKDVTTYVDIYVNGENLTDKLVSEGHATRSEEPECGDLPSCFASHVNSPSEFWIQLETATQELQAMEGAMVDAETFPELSSKEEGVICAAKYPEDGAWYRAQIIVDGSEGTEVLFMDYGNASIANELRSLPDDLKVKPALSRKCALQKPRDIKSWSRKSEIKFNELAAEGATIFNVQFVAAGDISIVELYLEGKSVTEELVGLCEEQPAAERPSPVGQDMQSEGKLCYVHSLREFYVNLEDSAPKIDEVAERLSAASEFEPALELKVGSVCAAFWLEDGRWYRAKILEFCDGGSHAQFIDFGNKAKCEEFRSLPEELAVLEPLAKCCRLAGVPDDAAFYEKGRNKLDELAVEDVTLRIEFLDRTNEPSLVKLTLNGKDVVTIISEVSDETTVAEVEETEDNLVSNPTVEVENTSDAIKEEPIEIEAKKNDDETNAEVDLNESLESNHTVIENKSFSADENLDDIDEGIKDDNTTPAGIDLSSETLNNSTDTIKTPEREVSKDSITDTGYTSGDKEPHSPVKGSQSLETEAQSPVKETKSSETVALSPVKETKSPEKIPRSPVKETMSPGKESQSPAKETRCFSPVSPVKDLQISVTETQPEPKAIVEEKITETKT